MLWYLLLTCGFESYVICCASICWLKSVFFYLVELVD
jgi:hypothetical protein